MWSVFSSSLLSRFGLFEAMSAIEMMDPKMDAGMLCNKAKKVLQFEPAVKVSNKNRSALQTCIAVI